MQENHLKQDIRIKSAYKKTFGTEEGQIVLMDLMQSLGAMSTTFDKDPYVSAFNEGKREAVLSIIHTIEMDLETYQKQMKSAIEQQEAFNVTDF